MFERGKVETDALMDVFMGDSEAATEKIKTLTDAEMTQFICRLRDTEELVKTAIHERLLDGHKWRTT